jgi:lipopolysaccharide transport system permease protein
MSPGRPAWGLVWTIVRTDFKARYHGTAGGFLWALFKPVAMFLVLWGVFSFVFANDRDYKLNLIIGLFLYDFFTEASKAALVALFTKGYLLTKSRCPPWILVVTSTSNAVITIALFSVVIVVVLTLTGRTPGPTAVLLFALYLVCMFTIVVGFCLAGSVLFLRYRDLNQVWDVVTQAGFFIAPVIYPIGILPLWVHFYMYLWPPTPVLIFARQVLVDGTVPSLRAHVCLALEAVVVLGAGILVYRRYAPRAAEYL